MQKIIVEGKEAKKIVLDALNDFNASKEKKIISFESSYDDIYYNIIQLLSKPLTNDDIERIIKEADIAVIEMGGKWTTNIHIL